MRSQHDNVRRVQPYCDYERFLLADCHSESARERQSYCYANPAADAPALAGVFVHE